MNGELLIAERAKLHINDLERRLAVSNSVTQLMYVDCKLIDLN